MDDKLLRMLGGLEYNELQRLYKDLHSGAYLMKHLVAKKINDLETKDRPMCASCNKNIQSEREEVYTLLFGNNIKKKASFCGMDCLNGFLEQIKRDKEDLLRRDYENQLRFDPDG
jgi:hypothetical protein